MINMHTISIIIIDKFIIYNITLECLDLYSHFLLFYTIDRI